MDVSGVQRVDLPTRDVLVVFDNEGDRRFVGFGGPNESFADAQIAAEQLPMDVLGSASALVTGTLGLNFPATAAAMHRAVDAAKSGSAVVSAHGWTVLDQDLQVLFRDESLQGTKCSLRNE